MESLEVAIARLVTTASCFALVGYAIARTSAEMGHYFCGVILAFIACLMMARYAATLIVNYDIGKSHE
jgi:ABC-type glycerol-3-phosphate transport system permease component